MPTLFATAAPGCAAIVAEELTALGAPKVSVFPAGVGFSGSMKLAYQACLGLRSASRVLLELGSVDASNADRLYDAIHAMNWADHLAADGTLWVSATGQNEALRNSQFIAQRVKDAVVDRLRGSGTVRPSVERDAPDLPLSVHVHRDEATVSIDLSGPLHRRGYRIASGRAPMRETLAAAVVHRARVVGLAKRGEIDGVLDPMCGSGTLVFEAWLALAGIAPGAIAGSLTHWSHHDRALHAELLAAAREHATAASPAVPLFGSDRSPKAIEQAEENVAELGRLLGREIEVQLDVCEVADLEPPTARGLLVTNPPYGERLGEEEQAKAIVRTLGGRLGEAFQGWEAAVFTAGEGMGRELGFRIKRSPKFHQGGLDAVLLCARIDGEQRLVPTAADIDATEFRNRVVKNRKKRKPLFKRLETDALRIYDRDLPNFAVAVDLYKDELHVQEYAAPASVSPGLASARFDAAVGELAAVFEVGSERIHVKRRQRQRGKSQYTPAQTQHPTIVWMHEGPARYLLDLDSYLDTGVFLDHRLVRKRIADRAEGTRFLNLFAYTATATVRAALAGARQTVSVDTSNRYLDWALENLRGNDIEGAGGPRHRLERADCMQWLATAAREGERFDLVLVDPPTFSNSKSREETFDVQRDHLDLLSRVARVCAPEAVVLFSTNKRGFKLDAGVEALGDVVDITDKTVPPDYDRARPPHRCFRLLPRVAAS